MKIGKKLTAVFLALLIYWLIFSIIITVSLMYPIYKKINNNNILNSIQEVKSKVENVQVHLLKISKELGQRNDIITYFMTNNKNLLSNNISKPFIDIYDLHNVIIFDKFGQIEWKFNKYDQFLDYKLIKNRVNKISSVVNFNKNNQPYFFISYPITNNNKKLGSVLIIKKIDSQWLSKLNIKSVVNFTIEKNKTINFKNKEYLKFNDNIHTTIIAPLQNKKTVIKLDFDDEIRKLGIRSLHSITLGLTVTIIFIILLQVLVLNRLILNRLKLFKSHIKNSNEDKKSRNRRRHRNDEIDNLIEEFDSIMKKLQLTQNRTSTLQNELHQSQKMEAIGQLAAGVAHVFNNNLQVIIGFMEIMKKDEHDKTRLEQSDMILKASHHCSRLTTKMLAFSKSDNLNTTEFYLHDLISNASNIMQEENPSSIITIISEKSPEILINGDFMKLQTVLINLLINAHESIDESGNIEISSRISQKYIVISIKDDGRGIPKESISKIFNPFFSTKDFSTGSGMGLAESYAIINNHNGTLECESSKGFGSTFTIKLPIIN